MEDITLLSASLLAFGKDCSLSPDLPESSDDLLASIYKPVKCIGYPNIDTKFLHKLLSLSKVVSWHARK